MLRSRGGGGGNWGAAKQTPQSTKTAQRYTPFVAKWWWLVFILLLFLGTILLIVLNPGTGMAPPAPVVPPTVLQETAALQARVDEFARTVTRQDWQHNVELFVAGAYIDFHRAFTFLTDVPLGGGNYHLDVDATALDSWGQQMTVFAGGLATNHLMISNCNATFFEPGDTANVTCIAMYTYTFSYSTSVFTTAYPTQFVVFQPVFSASKDAQGTWLLTYAVVPINATNTLLNSVETGSTPPGGVFSRNFEEEQSLRAESKRARIWKRDTAEDMITWNTLQNQMTVLLANGQDTTVLAICNTEQLITLAATFDPYGNSTANLCNTIVPAGSPPLMQPLTCSPGNYIDTDCLDFDEIASRINDTGVQTINTIVPTPGTLDYSITAGAGISINGGMHGITINVDSLYFSAPEEFNTTVSMGMLIMTKVDQPPNTVWAGPPMGGDGQPSFRTLELEDLSVFGLQEGEMLIAGPGGVLMASNLTAGSGISIVTAGGETVISATGVGSGTVTSVALALPASILSVSGSPVTTAGTLTGTLVDQAANTVWAGPAGAFDPAAPPVFRALSVDDFSALGLQEGQILIAGPGGALEGSNLTAGTGITIVTAGGETVISATGGGGSGTVTSVGLTLPAVLYASVSGSPVTTAGTLVANLAVQSANTFFAGPASGGAVAPTWRVIDADDLPLVPLGAGGTNNAGPYVGERVIMSNTAGTALVEGAVTGGNAITVTLGPGATLDIAADISAQTCTSPLDATCMPNSLMLSMLTVTGTTFLGTSTSCTSPLSASCYDISSQMCPGGPLGSNCIPQDLVLNSLMVNDLTLINSTMINVATLEQDAINVTFLEAQNVDLQGPLTCSGSGSIDSSCISLAGAMCPMGMPISESCIPAALTLMNATITGDLDLGGSLICTGGTLGADCIPDRVATINGISPTAAPALDFTVAAGSGITVTPGASSITVAATTLGTVTSVAMSVPAEFSLAGSPITSSGTLALTKATQLANTFWSGPTTGGAAAPAFRALDLEDFDMLLGSTDDILIGTAGGTVASTLTAGSGISIVTMGGATTITSLAGGGTVTSVALGMPDVIYDTAVTGSPVTTSGTLSPSLKSQAAGTFLAAPALSSGTPLFRTLAASDVGAAFGGMLDGQVLIGVTGSDPVADTLTAGIGIDIINAPGSVTVAVGGLGVDDILIGTASGTNTSTLVAGSGISIVTAGGTTTITSLAGGGSVTSVALSMPDVIFDGTVTGSPVTTSGTLSPALKSQAAATFFAAPAGSSGTPSFRALVASDVDGAFGNMLDGELIIGVTGGDPVANTLTAGTGIAVTNGAGTVDVSLVTLGVDDIFIGTGAGTTVSTLTAGTGITIVTMGGTTTITATSGAGTVTSVGLSLPGIFSVSGSPVTTTGTLAATLVSQSAATFFAAPTGSAGVPTFRTMALGDLPALTNGQLYIGSTGLAPVASQLTAGTLVSITPGAGTITVGTTALGTVTLNMPAAVFDVVTTPGANTVTLDVTLDTQTANTLWAGPTSGGAAAPSFRSLVAADFASMLTGDGQVLIGNAGGDPVAATITGTTNQVVVTNGAGSITLSTPQDIHTAATPTFASTTLTATTNQLTLGTTNTATISATAPAASRTYTISDPGADANVIMDTAGAMTVTNTPTTGQVLTATGSTTATWQTAGGGTATALTYNEIASTTTISSFSSSTFTLVTGMEFTPSSGVWHCWFHSSIDPSNANGSYECAIAVAGTEITSSVRSITGSSDEVQFGTMSLATVNGAQTLSVLWRKSGGSGNSDMGNRSFYCQRVGS